jgi:hypothetical protein
LATSRVSFRAAIEGDGPPGAGKVVLGCLTSGLRYNISIDAIGDAGGALAVKQITAPFGRSPTRFRQVPHDGTSGILSTGAATAPSSTARHGPSALAPA